MSAILIKLLKVQFHIEYLGDRNMLKEEGDYTSSPINYNIQIKKQNRYTILTIVSSAHDILSH